MPLAPATRLGPYEIIAPIGSGGMGEVYRARDTRLDRTVAIKILPPQIADRPELRQRFERDGKELFYLAPDRKLMVVEVKASAGKGSVAFEAGVPKALFETRVAAFTGAWNHYAVTGDGKRFLIVTTPTDETASTPTTVVVNWTAGVKR